MTKTTRIQPKDWAERGVDRQRLSPDPKKRGIKAQKRKEEKKNKARIA